MGLGGTCTSEIGYLCPDSGPDNFEVIRCPYLKMACNSKTAGPRVKRIDV